MTLSHKLQKANVRLKIYRLVLNFNDVTTLPTGDDVQPKVDNMEIR